MADTAKNWFYHNGADKSGPHTLDELQGKFELGEIQSHHFLWREGMAGWKKVSDLGVLQLPPVEIMPPAFEPPMESPFEEEQPVLMAAGQNYQAAPVQLQAQAQPAYAQPVAAAQPLRYEAEETHTRVLSTGNGAYGGGSSQSVSASGMGSSMASMAPSPQSARPQPSRTEDGLSALIEVPVKEAADTTGQLDISQLRNARKEAAKASKISQANQRSAPVPQFSSAHEGMGFFQRLIVSLLVLACLGGGAYFLLPPAYLDQVTQVMNKLMPPLPNLKDVSPEEYQALTAAVSAKLETGARTEFAISTISPETPSFYVVTNLSVGTPMILTLEPVVGTLVGDPPPVLEVSLTVADKLGKTPAIHTRDGASMPMGEYRVKITDKDKKILATHQYFLGGARDAAYQAKLNEYFKGQRERAKVELESLKALLGALVETSGLERQTVPTIAKITAPAARVQKWTGYEAQWSARAAALEKSIPQAKIFMMLFQSIMTVKAQAAQAHQTYKSQLEMTAPPATVASVYAGANPTVNQANAALDKAIADARGRVDVATKAVNSEGYFKEDNL